MKRVRKRMMMRTKILIMKPFGVLRVVQRANRVDTQMLIQMLCNARQMLASHPYTYHLTLAPPNPLPPHPQFPPSPLPLHHLLHHPPRPLPHPHPLHLLPHNLPPPPPRLLPRPLNPIPLLPLLPTQNLRSLLHPPWRHDRIYNVVYMARDTSLVDYFHNIPDAESGCGVRD